jgi:hypothetical protein
MSAGLRSGHAEAAGARRVGVTPVAGRSHPDVPAARPARRRLGRRLSRRVFDDVFPRLAGAIAAHIPAAPLGDVRDAALVLLFRLLFILYAEGRLLLPAADRRYQPNGLGSIRDDVGARRRRGEAFSATGVCYWAVFGRLCCAINAGDPAIGLPAYGGGLFDPRRTPLLTKISLDDAVMADVIDALSFEPTPRACTAIDYGALSVQDLGAVYEQLLELELVRDGAAIVVRPDVSARRTSGGYYTPGDLVALIIRETVGPLVAERMEAFAATADQGLDPAERLLDLKICDPAMGAGHFLVSLVDFLTERVIAVMTQAEAVAASADYMSPRRARIAAARIAILREAQARGVTIDPARLDDRHIVRRMVAARCVYGVDKNPMAVELAKAALQLHTFIPGAPLVFLDHHLRCGDSLFGLSLRDGIAKAAALGSPLLLQVPAARANGAAAAMQTIDGESDAGIASHRAAEVFAAVQEMTAPLDALLSLLHAFDWLDAGKEDQARQLIAEERFFNWEAAFPGVWPARARRSTGPGDLVTSGGFDAVIGNPPWDRMKLQQVEWFAARRRDIAMAPRAADRGRMIAALKASNDPLAQDYARASARAEAAARRARASGDYPLLSGGDVNLYSLFVERAMALLKPHGLVGVLVPSGIASDKTAAPFFAGVATRGRLKVLYDFENRRTRFGAEPFFPAVDGRFKFCVFVASPEPLATPAQCAFFLQDVSELADPQRCFPLTAQDFARVNPNTGTAPVFRNRRDADLTTLIYTRVSVLVDRSANRNLRGGGQDAGAMPLAGAAVFPSPAGRGGGPQGEASQPRSTAEVKAWPVRYMTMFHMTNDSHLFRTRAELVTKEKARPIGGNRWRSEGGLWLPLYEGKMAQAFDHRAASVVVNLHNPHRPAQPQPATWAQHQDPAWLPQPQYFVAASRCGWAPDETWVLGFKEITSPTNERTFIAALFPAVAFGNKIPLLRATGTDRRTQLLCANLNSIVFDFVTRQKIQGQTLNRFIVEQLPVIPPDHYGRRFGDRTAAQIVTDAVLELSYTSHDMAPFAADMGFTDPVGAVRPPFAWEDERRVALRAKLDAVFFHLYGVTGRDDVRYIYSTVPIVERNEVARHGRYLSRDLCLAWMDALEAGEGGGWSEESPIVREDRTHGLRYGPHPTR